MTVVSNLSFTTLNFTVGSAIQSQAVQEDNNSLPATGNNDTYTALAVSVARGVVAQISYSDFMETRFPNLIRDLASDNFSTRNRATNELRQAVINCSPYNLENFTQNLDDKANPDRNRGVTLEVQRIIRDRILALSTFSDRLLGIDNNNDRVEYIRWLINSERFRQRFGEAGYGEILLRNMNRLSNESFPLLFPQVDRETQIEIAASNQTPVRFFEMICRGSSLSLTAEQRYEILLGVTRLENASSGAITGTVNFVSNNNCPLTAQQRYEILQEVAGHENTLPGAITNIVSFVSNNNCPLTPEQRYKILLRVAERGNTSPGAITNIVNFVSSNNCPLTARQKDFIWDYVIGNRINALINLASSDDSLTADGKYNLLLQVLRRNTSSGALTNIVNFVSSNNCPLTAEQRDVILSRVAGHENTSPGAITNIVNFVSNNNSPLTPEQRYLILWRVAGRGNTSPEALTSTISFVSRNNCPLTVDQKYQILGRIAERQNVSSAVLMNIIEFLRNETSLTGHQVRQIAVDIASNQNASPTTLANLFRLVRIDDRASRHRHSLLCAVTENHRQARIAALDAAITELQSRYDAAHERYCAQYRIGPVSTRWMTVIVAGSSVLDTERTRMLMQARDAIEEELEPLRIVRQMFDIRRR